MNKIIAIGIVIMFLVSPVSVAQNNDEIDSSTGFKDVKSTYWAKDQIDLAVEKGYVSGFPDGAFRPDETVSRAQFIRMLVDALKLPHVEQGDPWYLPYVAALIETEIHKNSDFSDDYDTLISRLEMIRLVDRAVQVDTVDFTDKDFVISAAENGLIHGKDRFDLNINGFSTRAEAVVVVERVLEKSLGHKIPVSEDAVTAAHEL